MKKKPIHNPGISIQVYLGAGKAGDDIRTRLIEEATAYRMSLSEFVMVALRAQLPDVLEGKNVNVKEEPGDVEGL